MFRFGSLLLAAETLEVHHALRDSLQGSLRDIGESVRVCPRMGGYGVPDVDEDYGVHQLEDEDALTPSIAFPAPPRLPRSAGGHKSGNNLIPLFHPHRNRLRLPACNTRHIIYNQRLVLSACNLLQSIPRTTRTAPTPPGRCGREGRHRRAMFSRNLYTKVETASIFAQQRIYHRYIQASTLLFFLCFPQAALSIQAFRSFPEVVPTSTVLRILHSLFHALWFSSSTSMHGSSITRSRTTLLPSLLMLFQYSTASSHVRTRLATVAPHFSHSSRLKSIYKPSGSFVAPGIE